MTKFISILATILLFGLSFGQNKDELRKQNNILKKQIAEINANLSKNRNESRLSLAYLQNVEKKIKLREKVYNNTQKEKRLIENDIYLRQLEINRQNRALKTLRKNYSKVLINAYKNRGIQNKITFVLSANNIGQAIRRIQYLKQYSRYQNKKSEEIKNAALLLKQSIAEKQKSMDQKQILLSNQEKELKTIAVEKLQKERLLADFKKNEAKLIAELDEKKRKSKELEAKIRNIISEEIRLAKIKEEKERAERLEKERIAKIAAEKEKARIEAENRAKAEALAKARREAEEKARKAREEEERRKEEERKRAEIAAKQEATEREKRRQLAAEEAVAEAKIKSEEANRRLVEARAKEKELADKKASEKAAIDAKVKKDFGLEEAKGSNFADYRGKLNMPVYGTITHRFGRQPHPVFKGITEDNIGIKIAVKKGTQAKSIFPGVVSRIQDNGDGTRTIVIKHGSYFAVYSNMKSSSVSRNENVSAGTTLGTVAEDFDGTTTLDFQIWSGTNPVNPLEWVK